MTIQYPSIERIVEYNILSISLLYAKKADNAKVLSMSALRDVMEECEEREGDVYDKAVVLLKGIVQKHPFASGNRRTAFIATKDFLLHNHALFHVKDDPVNVKVMQGIRENYYSNIPKFHWCIPPVDKVHNQKMKGGISQCVKNHWS